MYVISIAPRGGDALGEGSLSADISIRPHKLSHTAVLLSTPHVLYCEGVAVAHTAIGCDQVQRFFFLAITNTEGGRTKYFRVFGLPKPMQNVLLGALPSLPGVVSSKLHGASSPDRAAQRLRLRDWRIRRRAFLVAP